MARNPGLNLAYTEGVQRELDALGRTPGSTYYVDSGAANTSDNNAGTSWDKPLATLDAAIGKCSASSGDVIYVAPGHAETVTAAITLDVAGVTVRGMGEGTARPYISCATASIDVMTITAANCVVENLGFNEATAAVNSFVNVAAANTTLRRLHMDAGANDVDAVTVTADGELLTVEDCTVIVTADGPDSWIKFEGVVDRPVIRRNHVIGSDGTNAYDDGVFDFNSQAVTNPIVYDNVFNGADVTTTVIANGGSVVGAVYANNVYAGSATEADNVGTGDVSQILAELSGTAGIASFPNAAIPANNVSIAEVLRQVYAALEGTAAGQNGVATWPAAAAPGNNVSIAEALRDVWDGVRNGTGGTEPGTNKSLVDALGTDGTAGLTDGFGIYPNLERCVEKSDGAMLSGDDPIFTVSGGPVYAQIWGLVTTVIGSNAGTLQLQIDTDTPAATVNLSTAVNVEDDAAGTSYRFVGATGVLTPDTNGAKIIDPVTVEDCWYLLPTGTVIVAGSAANTGVIAWYMRYRPLSPSSVVAAAA